MSQPSNGITPEVIRSVMPPYHLSPDLLQATFAALPPPPPDSTTAWRHAHIARLTQEISALMPANAAQARIAAQIVITRELADTLVTRAHAPGIELPLMCRLARTAATVMQTAAMLERSLTRHHQKPAPFFGTVLADEIDIPALDATWRGDATAPTPSPLVGEGRGEGSTARGEASRGKVLHRDLQGNHSANPGSTGTATTSSPAQPQPDADAAPPTPDAPDATTPEWSSTKLDEGPGWSREVLRHRSSREAGNGATPGSAP